MRRLSRAADKSLLWFAIAGVLGGSGRRLGRRGALRGVLSIAITSALVNLPAKLIARRRRPSIDPVPQIRRLARLPRSTSFPSGHAASGFVFGTGVALATKGLWPPTSEEEADLRPTLEHLASAPSPEGAGLTVAVNVAAGKDDPDDVVARLRDELPAARIVEFEEGNELREALEVVAEDAGVIGIVGGDGSVNAAAGVAHARRAALLVVPGGTLNHFARNLGVEDVADAVRAVKRGESVEVDVGTVGERIS